MVLQEELQRANKEKAALADKAKAEAQDLRSSIASLKAEVSDQKSKLQAASGLKTQLSELGEQLEEQRRMTEAKEGQLQEAASMKSRLAEVCSPANLTC